MQITKEFALNFTGLNSKFGVLEFPITPEIISTVTAILRGQEKWFKNFKFEMTPCKEFLKLEFIDLDLNKYVPKNFVKDSYANLLNCIQRYFTCEGGIIRCIHITSSFCYISSERYLLIYLSTCFVA